MGKRYSELAEGDTVRGAAGAVRVDHTTTDSRGVVIVHGTRGGNAATTWGQPDAEAVAE